MRMTIFTLVFGLGLVMLNACGDDRGSGNPVGDSSIPSGDSGKTPGSDASKPDASDSNPDAAVSGGVGDRICPTLAPMIASCAGQAFSEADCKGIYDQAVTRGCKSSYVDAFASFVTGGGTFQCTDIGLGQDLYPDSQDENVIIGMVCPLTLADSDCRSISCEFDQDCGQDSCNGATNACFSQSASCPSLPCEFDQDCPSNQACNNAIDVCIFLE